MLKKWGLFSLKALRVIDANQCWVIKQTLFEADLWDNVADAAVVTAVVDAAVAAVADAASIAVVAVVAAVADISDSSPSLAIFEFDNLVSYWNLASTFANFFKILISVYLQNRNRPKLSLMPSIIHLSSSPSLNSSIFFLYILADPAFLLPLHVWPKCFQ